MKELRALAQEGRRLILARCNAREKDCLERLDRADAAWAHVLAFAARRLLDAGVAPDDLAVAVRAIDKLR